MFESKERKFQCFICGTIFDKPEDFKAHILEAHEEGREYIVCPLKRCGYPVRDLRSHFKCKHPYDKIPRLKQMRALVWYDASNPHKAKRRKIPNFKEGYVTSAKNNGRQMHFRSSWEEDTYNCLERMNEVLSYDVEPFSIPYYYKGKRKKYYPDLKVFFADGHIEIWEIKPANQISNDMNTAKFNTITHYCLIQGWQFIVLDETDIQRLKHRLLNE